MNRSDAVAVLSHATPPTTLASRPALAPKSFVWSHTVTFGETNVMGNVYFVRQFTWQGECREMFLKTHCPSVLQDLARGLRLVTLSASAEFFAELVAFDEIEVRMRLAYSQRHRIGMRFETAKRERNGFVVTARGAQDIACMRLRGAALEPAPFPSELLRVLAAFEDRA